MYCQKCRTPLKVDGSLDDLNPAAYDLLIASSSSQQTPKKLQPSRPSYHHDPQRKALYDKASQNASPAQLKRANPTQRDSSMSFIYLTDSQVAQPSNALPSSPSSRPDPATTPSSPNNGKSPSRSSTNGNAGDESGLPKSYQMERLNKLFEILSARSDIDYPVCVECTDMLVEGLQRKLESAAKERDAYVTFLKQVQANQPSEEDVKTQEEALAKAKQAEADAMSELRRLEADKASLDDELAALEAEARELDRDEERFWRERNDFSAKLSSFQGERDSINSKFDHDSRLLETLQRSNVYNDTFCISHDGTFATINGLRLGRLASNPVDWPEINAAWGHALLLVVTVAEKLNYRFDGFEPVPMGSTSRIIRYELPSPSSSRFGGAGGPGGASSALRSGPPPAPKKHVLELFSAGDLPLGLTFMHRKFDNAMVAFLELVRQLGAFVERQTKDHDNVLSLPYKIEGDRINDISIKLGIAQDDGWTKACKLTLTCCKFLLAHTSNISSSSRGSGGN